MCGGRCSYLRAGPGQPFRALSRRPACCYACRRRIQRPSPFFQFGFELGGGSAIAPEDDPHCLLQRRAHLLKARLTEAIPPAEPSAGASLGFADTTHAPQQLQLTVWRPALPPAVLHFDRAATTGHVNEALLPLLRVHDATSLLVPVYPALDDSLHCVCTAGLDVCRAFLVVITGDSLPPGQALAVEPPCTDHDILRRLGCDRGLLTLSQQPWTGTQHGIYQGMHLRLQCAPSGRHTDVSHLHRIATPCRNQGSVRHFSRLQPVDFDAPAVCLEETTPPPRLLTLHGLQDSDAAAAHDVRTLCLAEALREPESALGFGLDDDMLAAGLAGYSLNALVSSLESVRATHDIAFTAWRSLPQFDAYHSFDELFFFVDGSYNPVNGRTAWALVAVGRRGRDIGKLGFMANFCECGAASAYQAELEALLHAECLASQVHCPIVHIASDCESALLVAGGCAPTDPTDKVGRAAVGIHFANRATPRWILRHKVSGHDGCAFNELADCVAKSYTCHDARPGQFSPGENFWSAVHEDLFQWHWILSCRSCSALPFLSCTGSWCKASCTFAPSTSPSTVGTVPLPVSGTNACQLRLRVIQYNCLSLKGIAASELMHATLSVHGYHLAFFQETRVQTAGISENSDFWILSSSADSHGREGCQVWLHKKSAIAHGDKHTWQRNSFTIVHAEPRILIVVVETAGLKFCLVSAHAPTSKQHQTVIHAWWQHLRACLRKAPAACIPILGIDANAKFEQDSRCPDTLGAPPKDCNAECLVSFASSCGLWISGQFGSDLSPLTSWVSPMGSRCLLDYILAPREWCTAAKTEPTPTLCDLHSDIDHKPVACTLCPRLCLKPPPPRKHVNWRALDTPFGQQVALFALQTAPTIAWDVDSTSHVAQLHEHFVTVASQWLPAPERKARNPIFSTATLQLILDRRAFRRTHRNVKRKQQRAFLAACFSSWQQATRRHDPFLRQAVSEYDRARMCAARWFAALHAQERRTRAAIAQDKAHFFREMNERARADGPAQFAHRLRAILRTGRKFKTPLVLPLMENADGFVVGREAVLHELGTFFADAERADEMDIPNMLASRQPAPPAGCLETVGVPSIPALASAFASQPRHKAPGLSAIPADFYRVSPIDSAALFLPVLLKAVTRGEAPWQWTGGLLHSIPKPGKDASTPEGWRSDFLLEADGKAVLKAVRQNLVTVMEDVRAPAQFGGLPKRPLSLPSSYVRAHLASLAWQNASGGILFLDVHSAYYSVIRDCLNSTAAQQGDSAFIEKRAARLFANADLRSQFTEAFRRGNLLEISGAEGATTAYFQAHLQSTWYTTRRHICFLGFLRDCSWLSCRRHSLWLDFFPFLTVLTTPFGKPGTQCYSCLDGQ